MQDRVSTYPGRVKLVPVDGAANTYDMEWADVPTQEGTPLNKATLLSNSTAALMDLGASATPNDMLAALARRVGGESGPGGVVPVERGGTGGTTPQEARTNLGLSLPISIENGGTGAKTAAEARANLGISGGGGPGIATPVSVANGGTGATTAPAALGNLGIKWGTTDLVAGVSSLETGTLYFVYK